MKWHDKNFGKSPFDPDYVDDYDPEEDFENFIDAAELRYELRRDNKRTD